MSVEALYAVRFGHAGAPNLGMNGGVVVLETDRVFGGDTWFAYTGSYKLEGDTVTGEIHAKRHFDDPDSESAWGTQESEFDVQFSVTLNEDKSEANGTMSRPGATLGLRLVRFAELP